MENTKKPALAETPAALKLPRAKKRRMKPFDYINYILLGLFAFLCAFPVAYVILLSISSRADYLNAKLLVLPFEPHIDAYKFIFQQGKVGQAFGISIFITVVYVLYATVLTSLGAYAFTKKNVPGLKIIFTFIVATMFFSGGLIPFYMTTGSIIGTNNLAVLIIPFGISSFNMIVLRNFFKQVPDSLIESCKLDGASEFRILIQFIMPLSKAGIATIMLFYTVSKWDDWYWPSLFLTKSRDLHPLALRLRDTVLLSISDPLSQEHTVNMQNLFGQGRNAAMIVVTIIPILAIYPFLQKYFTKGVMIGSVKQ
ncbi:MAG: carbohydrate ABC transporter permease [Clostridiales bacterium]|jgi:putative aldouronate transport system permease protein|nr:carbohydrate ABC transporter permease [Clostridiales bacterium]